MLWTPLFKHLLHTKIRKGARVMKIVMINGQSHRGSTYHIAKMIADKLEGETKEFFLPRDFDKFCIGCGHCFSKGEDRCPHYEQLQPITNAIDESDVIILASPVYVFNITGPMKALLDHYGYRWMSHRPNEKMFKKQAVCVSTAAGAGMGKANKTMADSTFFWGCAKTYKLGIAVWAADWNEVGDEIKEKAERKATALANKIKKNKFGTSPSIKTKLVFNVMRKNQTKGWNKLDQDYWYEKGWLNQKRPWN